MSAPVSGKFQDHYTILGLQPGADTETIRAAYASLAEKFSPNNPRTGDDAKFESIGLAYEVLSDPLLRAEFDKLKGIDREAGHPTFTGIDFFRALQQGAELRAAVLCICTTAGVSNRPSQVCRCEIWKICFRPHWRS